MLFNSIDFALFLPLVFGLYWLIPSKRIRTQNALISLASFIFYGWWDVYFLGIMLVSIVIDYGCGQGLEKTKNEKNRKYILLISVISNLSILAIFKYFNFFIESFNSAFSLMGMALRGELLNIVLPVGISFYTFQTLSYTIDVYKQKIKPCSDFLSFSSFVSFFPQLVAGPIEKAGNLLPQFERERHFDYGMAVLGCKQILWGIFKKCVIADNCAVVSDDIFQSHEKFSGSALLVAAILFSFQIYGDFSGYSDIAIGTARLFGITLSRNFNYPYFSQNLVQFWRKWHISLSGWFKDYVYIPLGGNRMGLMLTMRNIFIVFLLSGLWHGASWNFIVWGGLHGIIVCVSLIKESYPLKHYIPSYSNPSWVISFFKISITFTLVSLLWIFFRADNLSVALDILTKICSLSLFSFPGIPHKGIFGCVSIMISFMLFLEWKYKYGSFPLEVAFIKNKRRIRWIFYILLLSIIGLCMHAGHSPFIYFQF